MTRVRVSLTIDKKLAEKIDKQYRKRLAEALNKNEPLLPKLSHEYEFLLIEGWNKANPKDKIQLSKDAEESE